VAAAGFAGARDVLELSEHLFECDYIAFLEPR
jgi:hypothetical protein